MGSPLVVCQDCYGTTFHLCWDGDVVCATCCGDEPDGSGGGTMGDLYVVGDDRGDGPIGPPHLQEVR